MSSNMFYDRYTKLEFFIEFTHDNLEYTEQIEEELDKYPDKLNRQTKSGDTPVMRACRKAGYSYILELLLKYNPDIYIKDNDGLTAYDHAVRSGDNNMINLLDKYQDDVLQVKCALD